ncbi:YraN family protein [Pseudoflavonifractor sp. MSJ-30]|uniref:YraN family protein n=1 Tax=Pseudoflavonifractor sp. MSJ-30 TaxID=2841525 RepID=UPI001C1293BE|nr:YraN family protein [Pseudoflavonifractor sp. MSJ-30]MBU5451679.1 YraN family protein [Pseudoflavonifractor sp. MSJ-30]
MANLLGPWGEAQAADYLRRKGYTLVAANYRCRFGEIDLIVRNRRYLVFVEVKLRKSAGFAQAREFVDFRKQQRIRATASMYLSRYPTSLQPRFDVIEIYAPQGMETKKLTINHLEDAFE